MVYAYGLPGPVVWTSHILIGALVAFIGYDLLMDKGMIQWSVDRVRNAALTAVVLGVVMLLYHSHLWIFRA